MIGVILVVIGVIVILFGAIYSILELLLQQLLETRVLNTYSNYIENNNYEEERRQAVRDSYNISARRQQVENIINHYGSIPEFIKPCGEVILDKDCQPVLVEEFITEEEMEI